MTAALQIRTANINDVGVMWDWYHEPLRTILFPKSRVTEKARCSEWFKNELENPDTVFLIGLIDIVRIGAVRFRSRGDRRYEAFVHLKPAYSRQGLLPELLKASVEKLAETKQPKEVYLSVPAVNPASRAVFEKSGLELSQSEANGLHWIRRW